MRIYCVRIGDRYGPKYEEYLESKLGEIIWIRNPIHPKVPLQWNKMYPMSLDWHDPVCVIDIDILLENDYMDLFNYPINKGQFISIPSWWGNPPGYKINGGFFKYYPCDCNYIYEKFMSNIEKWKYYYINNKTTIGPVNGEQYFVEDSVKEKLELKLIPNSWVTRWSNDSSDWQFNITNKYKEASGNDYVNLGGWHPDIKLIHFTHAMNKPNEIL